MRKLANEKIKKKEEISISLKDAKKIYRILESIVVSMNRIGSAIAAEDLSPSIAYKVLVDYFTDFNAMNNLAMARRIMSKIFDEYGESKNIMNGVQYWEWGTAYKKSLSKISIKK